MTGIREYFCTNMVIPRKGLLLGPWLQQPSKWKCSSDFSWWEISFASAAFTLLLNEQYFSRADSQLGKPKENHKQVKRLHDVWKLMKDVRVFGFLETEQCLLKHWRYCGVQLCCNNLKHVVINGGYWVEQLELDRPQSMRQRSR